MQQMNVNNDFIYFSRETNSITKAHDGLLVLKAEKLANILSF